MLSATAYDLPALSIRCHRAEDTEEPAHRTGSERPISELRWGRFEPPTLGYQTQINRLEGIWQIKSFALNRWSSWKFRCYRSLTKYAIGDNKS
jgi:hypothetical protein